MRKEAKRGRIAQGPTFRTRTQGSWFPGSLFSRRNICSGYYYYIYMLVANFYQLKGKGVVNTFFTIPGSGIVSYVPNKTGFETVSLTSLKSGIVMTRNFDSSEACQLRTAWAGSLSISSFHVTVHRILADLRGWLWQQHPVRLLKLLLGTSMHLDSKVPFCSDSNIMAHTYRLMAWACYYTTKTCVLLRLTLQIWPYYSNVLEEWKWQLERSECKSLCEKVSSLWV